MVVAGGETVPLPTTPERGFPTLSFEILIPTEADYQALQRAYTRRTDEVALGGLGGYVVVHARRSGGGLHTLSYPTGEGNVNQNFDAVLASFTAQRFVNDSQGFFGRGSVSFVILSGITP